MKKISEAEARAKVLAHVAGLDLKGWRLELGELRRSETERGWIAVFDSYSPSGTLVDGPVCFLVNISGVHDGPMAM